MISVYEDFPDELHNKSFKDLTLYGKCNNKPGFEFILANGESVEYAAKLAENILCYKYENEQHKKHIIENLFAEFYPEVEDRKHECVYIDIDYNAFADGYFEEFTDFKGNNYLVYSCI